MHDLVATRANPLYGQNMGKGVTGVGGAIIHLKENLYL